MASLVDRALEKAAEYEKQGNAKEAEHFLRVAERAEEIYKVKEKEGR